MTEDTVEVRLALCLRADNDAFFVDLDETVYGEMSTWINLSHADSRGEALHLATERLTSMLETLNKARN